jgi:hypothetical protein
MASDMVTSTVLPVRGARASGYGSAWRWGGGECIVAAHRMLSLVNSRRQRVEGCSPLRMAERTAFMTSMSASLSGFGTA